MGGGDADAFRRVERVRREFNRLHIQPQGTTHQVNPFFMEPQAMRQLSCFNPLVFLPHDTTQLMTREATLFVRRVYVSGLPPSANEQTIGVFFNQVMAAIGGTGCPGDAVRSVCMNHEQRFALVEFRMAEEASNAMALDGILFEGVPVKIRRPADYNPSQAAALGPTQPSPKLNLAAVGLTEGSDVGGLENPNRIFVGGLPYYFTEAQVRELLESFGPLQGFDLVKDRETGDSKGYAFCVYMDTNVTDIACAALNGIKMGDRNLTVRRANQGASQLRAEQESILLQAQQQVQMQKLVDPVGAAPTKVLCLVQVVTADGLKDDEHKRVSGFDAPPPQALGSTFPVIPTPSQLPGTSLPNIGGMFPNMLPFGVAGQFNPLVIQPQAMTQQATHHARRVYVGGLPPSANEQTVAVYFNQVMAAIGGNTAGPGDAVLNVYINHDKKLAFVEMRSVEEASNAMALDGIMFEGAPVKVRRPTDYNPSLAAALGPSQPSANLNLAAVGLTAGSTGGLEGPDRIFVGGLPYYFTEAQVRELLESFGPLRGFDLVKDKETGNSKGYAFCVYQDITVTDIACAALNGIKMGDKTLTVRRANQGASQPRPEQESILLQAQQQVQLQKLVYQVGALPTKVVCLTQVVSADELKDDEEYDDIMEDMRLEAGRYGNLVKVIIPRPDPSGQPVAGVGKVFLEYADIDGAAKAKTALHGRKFGGNPVVAVCYAEDKFANGEYDG